MSAARPRLLLGRIALVALAATLAACESDPLSSSCGGGRVELCGPHEWAELAEPSLEPPRLPIADFTETATIRIAIARCDDAPAPHVVDLSAIYPDGTATGDAGPPVRVTNLLTLTEGEDGDTPGDGMIEVEVRNPFIATLPEETELTLRFTARSTAPAGCTSGVAEIPYTTGPRRE